MYLRSDSKIRNIDIEDHRDPINTCNCALVTVFLAIMMAFFCFSKFLLHSQQHFAPSLFTATVFYIYFLLSSFLAVCLSVNLSHFFSLRIYNCNLSIQITSCLFWRSSYFLTIFPTDPEAETWTNKLYRHQCKMASSKN